MLLTVLPLLSLKSAKSREIPRKFELIAVQGHPRSSPSKVIDLGANRKHICNLLLVINNDFGRTVSEILTHKARRALTRDPTVL